MSKQPDWDAIARLQRAQRHGTQYAYDELPPVGSYADQVRCISGKGENDSTSELSSRTMQFRTQKKIKPSLEDKLLNLHRAMEELLAIPGSTKWNKKGLEYQHRLLTQMRSTLSSMLKLDPSANSGHVSIEAHRIFNEYGSTDSVK